MVLKPALRSSPSVARSRADAHGLTHPPKDSTWTLKGHDQIRTECIYRYRRDLHDVIIPGAVRQTAQPASEAALRTGSSRVAASRRLLRLTQAGLLLRQGQGTRPTWQGGPRRLWRGRAAVEALRNPGSEFAVWEQHLAPLLPDVPVQTADVASIAFTEVPINALGHAQATQVARGLHVADGRLQMFVADDGARIFRHIAQALNLFDTRLALLERRGLSPTEVPVRLDQLSSQLISRSQAKWVVDRATEFRTVVLDFEGVALAGQAFADEIFRVLATAHPEVRLRHINTLPAVESLLRGFGARAATSG